MPVLPRSFYLRTDVVAVARDLLGKYLCTWIGEKFTSGMIVETEAYAGASDRASHAYGNRRTARTEIMFRIGGTAYVYLCYGMHSLFNVVTNDEGIPHAVLIRGIVPADGPEHMLERTDKKSFPKNPGIGPGKVSKLVGIHYSHTGIDLTVTGSNVNKPFVWIEDRGYRVNPGRIKVTARIGVGYAGEDAHLPYRFILVL